MTLDSIATRWNLLTSVAVTLCTAAGGFLVLPPLLARDAATWSRFGIFAVTLLVGLCFVPMQLYRSLVNLRRWFVVAITASGLAIVGFTAYSSLSGQWTFEWRPAIEAKSLQNNSSPAERARPAEYVLAGAELSASAQAAQLEISREKGGIPLNEVPPKEILYREGGDIAATWIDSSERERRLHILLTLYLTELFLLAVAAVTVVQATYCASSRVHQP